MAAPKRIRVESPFVSSDNTETLSDVEKRKQFGRDYLRRNMGYDVRNKRKQKPLPASLKQTVTRLDGLL